MCIITGSVAYVGATKLLVMPSTDTLRQLTVYSNNVTSYSKNLMILPVPYPSTIRFELLTMDYDTLFVDAKKSFKKLWKNESQENTRSIHNTLEIFDVGSYKVSIAHTVQDLLHIDKSLFNNSENLVEHLKDEYPPPFGFLVCMLKEGSSSYKPLAYSHDLWNNALFLPTKHYHPDTKTKMHMQPYINNWDHEIYSLGTPITYETHSLSYMPHQQHNLNLSYFSKDFQHLSLPPLRRLDIKGGYKNIDIILQLEFKKKESTPYTFSLTGFKQLKGAFK